MTAPSLAEENKERAQIMKDEAALREHERISTFLDHAQAAALDELGGRFARIQPQSVTGSTPIPQYPAASAPFQSDPCGVEPPLGTNINFVEPCGTAAEIEASLRVATGFQLPVAAGPTSAEAPSLNALGDEQRSDVGPPSTTPAARPPSSKGPKNGS
jgi:hypothetical protein